MNVSGALPIVAPVAYSGAAAKERQRRLARVRLAELVALRRAARSSSAAGSQPPGPVSPVE